MALQRGVGCHQQIVWILMLIFFDKSSDKMSVMLVQELSLEEFRPQSLWGILTVNMKDMWEFLKVYLMCHFALVLSKT